MSHQTIVVREQDVTLRVDAVIIPSRDPFQTSKIKLPAGGAPLTFVDENGGLLLTLDSDGNIISEKGFFELTGQAEPAVSPAGKMRFYFDLGTNKFLISENGGAYASILAGAGDVIGPASATDEALVRWDTATGKLVQDSNALLNDAGDLTLVGSQSLGKFLDVAGIAAPAVSPAGEARLYFDSGINKFRISENGGAFGDIGDVAGPASVTDEALVRWDTATGKLVQDSNALLNDAGDLTLVGSQSLGKFLDVTGIAAPALSSAGEARLYFDSTSNKLRVSENGGAFGDVVGGGGDVVGPASATDEALVRWDGATGKLVQDSNVTVDDSGNLVTTGTVASNGGTFTAASAGSVALVAKGFAAQTAALQEWRDSSDTVLASMTFVTVGTRLTTRAGDRLELESGETDSALAIGFVHRTINTLSTLGSRHTVWENNGTDLLSLSSESSGATLQFHRTAGGDAPVLFVRSTNQLAINMSGVANNFDFAFVTGGVFIMRGGGVDRGQIAVTGNGIAITSRGSTAPLGFVSSAVTDSATVPGFRFRISTAGTQLHTLWQTTASNTTILSLNRTGILDFTTTDALGGGAAPTLGTIGGTGPTAAAQSKWLKIRINGTDHWIPAWV